MSWVVPGRDYLRNPLYDPRPEPLSAPTTGATDAPVRVLCINADWAGHVLGVLQRLERRDAWTGDDSEWERIQDELAEIVARLSTPFEGDCPVVYPETEPDGPATPGDCSGGETIVKTVTETVFAGGVCWLEDLPMSLCGYNPKAFKIENGSLWVRDFCGDWVEIGSLTNEPELPPVTDLPDPPPDGYEDSTACAMADALAKMVCDIVQESFDEITNALDAIALWDYYNDMNAAFREIDLAYGDLINMWAGTVAVNAAGLEIEATDPLCREWLRCYFTDNITARNDGITEAEYNACINETDAALKNQFPKGSYEGFGNTIRDIYHSAIKAIGPMDAQKITYYAQPDAAISCGCPVIEEGIIGPTVNGWYLGEEMTFTVACNGGFSYTPAPFRQYLEHDVYGVWFRYEHMDANPINNLKRYNSCMTPAPDYCFTQSNSDTHAIDTDYCQMGNAAYADMSPLLDNPSLDQTIPKYSDVVASPVATAAQVVEHVLSGQRQGNEGEYVIIKFRLRYLHNNGSPSHTS